MKTLQNNFTTPEQSKRLLEVGVPADSADCYYYLPSNTVFIDGSLPRYFVKEKVYTELKEWYDIKHGSARYELIPCWSFGQLMKIYLTCAADYNPSYDDFYEETPSIHFMTSDKDKLIDEIIELFDEDEMDFSKLED